MMCWGVDDGMFRRFKSLVTREIIGGSIPWLQFRRSLYRSNDTIVRILLNSLNQMPSIDVPMVDSHDVCVVGRR